MSVSDPLVVVEEEALDDEDVHPRCRRVRHLGVNRHSDSMGTGKLDWIFLPAFDSVYHGLHVEGSDD